MQQEAISRWHRALLETGDGVREEVAAWALPRVTAILQRSFRSTDWAIVEEAAEEAILRYLNRPVIWEPSRSGLLTFLAVVARKRLLTRLGAEKRRVRHEQAFAGTQPASTGPLRDPDAQAMLGSLGNQIARTPAERRFLAALLEGERRTAEYARILGITQLPVDQQRHEVKRLRDRLLKRARRMMPR
jgi:DNA-directed RNA polymerase specialized sigma24 family protein